MLSEVVNTMGSGATNEVTQILNGPAGEFIYFGIAITVIGIGIFIFRKFSGGAK